MRSLPRQARRVVETHPLSPLITFMLVKNDFLSHWKTRLLCKRHGDGPALRALLALWSYCEQRRAWQFNLTPLELAGVCDFGGNHDDLYRDLVQLRLIVEVGEGFWEVNGWGELNSALVHKWPGRRLNNNETYHPRGYISKAIAKPQGEPIAQPQGDAIGQAIGLDRIGEDRIGLEGRGRDHAPDDPEDLRIFIAKAAAFSKANAEGLDIPEAFVRHWHDIRTAAAWERKSGQMIPNRAEARFADLRLMARNAQQSGELDGFRRQQICPQKKEGAAPVSSTEPEWDWRGFSAAVLGWEPVGDWNSQTARSRSEIKAAWPAATPEQRAKFVEKKEGAALAIKTGGEP